MRTGAGAARQQCSPRLRACTEFRSCARGPGAGWDAAARTPFRLAGLGASVRFSTMNPFLRPTARPVLSIPPGILAACAAELPRASKKNRACVRGVIPTNIEWQTRTCWQCEGGSAAGIVDPGGTARARRSNSVPAPHLLPALARARACLVLLQAPPATDGGAGCVCGGALARGVLGARRDWARRACAGAGGMPKKSVSRSASASKSPGRRSSSTSRGGVPHRRGSMPPAPPSLARAAPRRRPRAAPALSPRCPPPATRLGPLRRFGGFGR